jgi:hypothetical protein
MNIIISSPLNISGVFQLGGAPSSISPGSLSIEKIASGSLIGSTKITQSITNTSVNSLLVVTLAYDDGTTTNGTSSLSSNPSLNWIHSVVNPQGVSGTGPTDIWTARNTVGGSIAVTASLDATSPGGGMVIYSFINHNLSGSAASGSNKNAATTTIIPQNSGSIVVGVVCDWDGTNSPGYPTISYTGSAVKTWDDTIWGVANYTGYHFYYTTMNLSGSTYTGGLTSPVSPGNQGICLLEIKSI